MVVQALAARGCRDLPVILRPLRWRLPVLFVLLVLWAAVTPARSGKSKGEDPGQDAPDPLPSEIEERVTVEADGDGVADVAAFATVVDTTEIAGRGEDLADVLRRVPGARVRQYGGFGQYATLSLRSSTAEQVTIQVDGIPQNRALGDRLPRFRAGGLG